MKDTLYLLKPGFLDGETRWFCPGCATVEGMLSFYPHLREKVDVQYVGYARPRPQIASELGEENQGAPVLIVRDLENLKKAPPSVHFGQANGKPFVNEPVEICEYLALVHGADRPH